MTYTGLRIRAVPADDPAAVALRRAMYQDLAGSYPGETAQVEAAGGFEALDRRRARTWTDVLVADLDGVSVGHAGTRAATLPGRAPGEAVEVRSVFVAPGARRAGVATALHGVLVERARARGVRVLLLETGTTQPAAIALYRGLGYTDTVPFAPHAPDPTSVFLALET